MVFDSLTFLAFYACFFVAYHLLGGRHRLAWQNRLVVVGSFIFVFRGSRGIVKALVDPLQPHLPRRPAHDHRALAVSDAEPARPLAAPGGPVRDPRGLLGLDGRRRAGPPRRRSPGRRVPQRCSPTWVQRARRGCFGPSASALGHPTASSSSSMPTARTSTRRRIWRWAMSCACSNSHGMVYARSDSCRPRWRSLGRGCSPRGRRLRSEHEPTVLDVPMTYADADFATHAHLGTSGRSAFTAALARALLDGSRDRSREVKPLDHRP